MFCVPVTGNYTIETDSLASKAVEIRFRVPIDGFAAPLSIFEMSDWSIPVNAVEGSQKKLKKSIIKSKNSGHTEGYHVTAVFCRLRMSILIILF